MALNTFKWFSYDQRGLFWTFSAWVILLKSLKSVLKKLIKHKKQPSLSMKCGDSEQCSKVHDLLADVAYNHMFIKVR